MRSPFRAALLIGAAILFSLAPLAAPAPGPPLCRVQASATPARILGRVLTVQLRPGCPPGGLARLRLESTLGGSQPDNPPGVYTLRPGMVLKRAVLPWWHLSWIDRSGRAWPVPEQ